MSRRVLVADDSATIQKVIKIAFSRHELEIVEAASLIESLASVTRIPVDVLILDASLPGARGPADFAKLRADANDVPALLLVGTYDSVDEQAFREAGFTHFLKKPFESTDIVSMVDMLLGSALDESRELTPPPPIGRPQHPTMIVPGGAFDQNRGAEEQSYSNMRFASDEDDDEPAVAPPPPPALDQARKGRRAFSELEDTKSRVGDGSDDATDPRRAALPNPRGINPLPPIPAAHAPREGMGLNPSAPSGGDSPSGPNLDRVSALKNVSNAIDEDLPVLVRQAVEDYCERNFKSLAREIIATELRRLADEKARHLVDN